MAGVKKDSLYRRQLRKRHQNQEIADQLQPATAAIIPEPPVHVADCEETQRKPLKFRAICRCGGWTEEDEIVPLKAKWDAHKAAVGAP